MPGQPHARQLVWPLYGWYVAPEVHAWHGRFPVDEADPGEQGTGITLTVTLTVVDKPGAPMSEAFTKKEMADGPYTATAG